ncbi:hypothetical protein BKA70DRAFT_1447664 [Coprinopsis sp. MPI-PUGE-AT-0042]|nr:hypothetical protein BKA70DRAFT_1447664 [Coprinopsis sp. MPI-PUGE-AT-0042]
MTVQAETMECMEWPLSMPYSNDLETWFPLLDAQLTATDDIFEVGRLEGAALLEPPSQEPLHSFHAPSDHELMSYLLKRKRLVIALGKAAVRIEQLKDLCNRYEGLPKSIRSRLRVSTIKYKGFKELVAKKLKTRPTAGSGMSREQLTSVLQSVTQSQAVEGLSSDPQHLFSAAQAIETLVCSLRDLATQYERDSSQLEASIHLCTCAGSITRLLPDELLLKIFSYLSGTSQKARPFVDCIDGSTMPKIAAALTCRRWKHIIFDYPELWSSLRVDCSSFQYAKLRALPTTIPGLDRHIARAQMSMKMDIELIAWDAPQKPDLEDSKLLKAQVKLLVPLPMILMANWSTLMLILSHVD